MILHNYHEYEITLTLPGTFLEAHLLLLTISNLLAQI